MIMIAAALALSAAPAFAEAGRLVPVEPAGLRLESGKLGSGTAETKSFSMVAPANRAVAPGSTGTAARLRFTWRGPTQQLAPLASGEARQQIGLKLKALDQCNLVYVMWRLAPTPGLVVQVKSNPGQRTHGECGDKGYRTVENRAPRRPLPAVVPQQPHELAAYVEGEALSVLVDGEVAWTGVLPEEARALEGPVGVRSDNGEFELQLWAALRGAP